MSRVKVCGVTTLHDVGGLIELGVDLIGLNFVSSSPRRISVEHATRLVRAIAGRAEVVAVVCDQSLAELRALQRQAGVDRLQLHGNEPPELLEQLGVDAFKAVRIASAEDVEAARSFGGDRLLVDAKVPGALGGTGHRFDWQLVGALARERQLLLAGGITPENAADAVRQVKPWALDVASGVERAPGIKDLDAVERLVSAARSAAY